jgi:hypothetical protein
MGREATVGNQILELFEVAVGPEKRRFSLQQIYAILDHLDPQSVKSALDRLRGQDGGTRRLQVVGYLTQQGHGGLPMPVFTLGTDPDVPRTDEYVEDTSAVARRRLNELRRRHSERQVLKDLDAIDNYG